jgi:superfamily I DNA/RNA helicase
LLRAIPSFGKRYDAIIVDEGQDFRDHWWIPLEDLFADAHRGVFYIFLDPGQNIYQEYG